MNHSLHTARTLIEQHELTLERLWIRYWAQGGNASLEDLGRFVYEVEEAPPLDLTLLERALNDLSAEGSHD